MATPEDLARMRAARIPRAPKVKKPLRQKSLKRQAKEAAERKLVSSDGDTLKEQWFKARRREMTGFCACGCGETSSKKDNVNFRSSIAHILPKELFKSVMYHPLNWVERRFWAKTKGDFNACHSIMDETGLDRWVNMEDWPVVKERFKILAPLLTVEEKKKKFYLRLEKLVYEN